MDPASLVPEPSFLSVPWGWFYGLLILTFVLHILFMNVLVGGGIIALFSGRGQSSADPTAKTMSKHLPIVLAFTVNIGIAPLLFLQVLYGNFMYSSSQLMAVWWLSVVFLVMVAYALLYVYKFKFDSLSGGRVLVAGVSMALLLITGFFLVNNMTFMIDPGQWTRYFDNRDGLLLNFGDPQLIPRYLHFMTAALAVGGLYTAVVWKIKYNRGAAGASERIKTGMRWFYYATAAQLFIGPLFLATLDSEVAVLLLGDNLLYTGTFLGAMLLVALTLVLASAGKVYATAVSTVVLVFAMAFVRDFVRTAYLAPYHDFADMPTNYQYSPMIVFLTAFVGGLALVYYMLKLAFRTKEAR